MVTEAGSAVEVEAHRHEAAEVVQEVSDSIISIRLKYTTKKRCILEIENSIGLLWTTYDPKLTLTRWRLR